MVTSVNISAVKDFQRCRLRWYYKWVKNRVPRHTPKALSFGKILHLVFEEHFKNPDTSMEKACEIVIARAEEEIGLLWTVDGEVEQAMSLKEAVAELRDYVEPLSLFKDKFKFERTLEVEEPFEVPLDNGIILKGRPDRVVEYQGRTFHVQNRSIAGSKNLGLYTEIMQLDMHELIYGYVLQNKYPKLPFGGVIFNLMRKLKYRGVNGKILNDTDKIFSQYIVMLKKEHMMQAWKDLHWVVNEMLQTEGLAAQGIVPAHSRDLNAGMFGNSKDPYFDVFTGKISLDDDRYFMDREDTYADAPASEE